LKSDLRQVFVGFFHNPYCSSLPEWITNLYPCSLSLPGLLVLGDFYICVNINTEDPYQKEKEIKLLTGLCTVSLTIAYFGK